MGRWKAERGQRMGGMQGLLDVLDTRSFSSMWYWLILASLWTWLGRGALGIPAEVVAAVRRRARTAANARAGADEESAAAPPAAHGPAPASLLLLDWLSLTTPRWQVPPRDGAILLGVACFVLTLLAGLGFLYGMETAQALALLMGPLLVLAVLRVRLAARLAGDLAAAEAGRLSPDAAAETAATRIARHMRHAMALSVIAVAGTALWGTLWLAVHNPLAR